MKSHTLLYVLIFIFTGAVFAQEYDDMYFNPKDRKAEKKREMLKWQKERDDLKKQEVQSKTDAPKAYQEEFSWDSNPDFVARYENYVQESEGDATGEDYFVEEDDRFGSADVEVPADNRQFQQGFSNNGCFSCSPWNSWNNPMMNPWMSGFNRPFGMYDPFFNSPIGFRPGLNVGLGWNSWTGWGTSIGFNSMWGNPMMAGGMNPWMMNGFYDPWMMGGFHDPFMMGGFHNPWFGPTPSSMFWGGYMAGMNRPGNALVIGSEAPANSTTYTGQRSGRSTAIPTRDSRASNDSRNLSPDNFRYQSRRDAVTSGRRAGTSAYRSSTPVRRSSNSYASRPSSSRSAGNTYYGRSSSGRDFSTVQRRGSTSNSYTRSSSGSSSSYGSRSSSYSRNSSYGRSSSGSYNRSSSSSRSYGRSSSGGSYSRSSSSGGSRGSSSGSRGRGGN